MLRAPFVGYPERMLAEDSVASLITLWDCSAEPSGNAGLTYRWNGYAEDESVRSLLRYVETHSDRLREKYLAWVHDLGESRIGGKRLVDHLALADGFSYWWMTPFVEKSPWKTPSIVSAIRLLALEEIFAIRRPSHVRLVSANRNLHLTLRNLCQSLGISYDWERIPGRSLRQLGVRGVYRALPQPVQALLDLARYLCARWMLRRAETSRWFGGDRALFVCSYFFHMDSNLAKKGQFHSRYWEGLHGLMGRLGLAGNWLEIYYAHDAVPNPEVALDWVRRFNRACQEEGFHTFLDAYLSWSIVLDVVRCWLRLMLLSWRLGKIKDAFRPQDSRIWFWPLMREDWRASMRGGPAITNLLWVGLFDQAMRNLPHQEKGLYLCENQAWERAFIHAWRKYGHGQLIAVAHSTVRFWDLRYFIDPRTPRSQDPYPMPQADLMALNGKAARDAYLSVDRPKETIVECEALRYGYVIDRRAELAQKAADRGATKILILGDFLPSGTVKMLQMLEKAAPLISAPAAYTAKPHPNYMIRAEDYPSLNLEIVADPLGGILRDYDIAYCSNMTSAAVDAYLDGLPVVVMLDETELNFSPLRGQPGILFVSAPKELADALQTVGHEAVVNPGRKDFFWLDPELPRWKRLLSDASSNWTSLDHQSNNLKRVIT